MKTAIALMTTAMASVTAALGATATFTPTGPTTVLPGTNVAFAISVVPESLTSFDAADIVIGSDHATGMSFAYSTAWRAAFANVTEPTATPFYKKSVFVGGNTGAVTGPIVLGTVTVGTAGMGEGTYDVRIDPDLVPGVSSLTLGGGQHDPLQGSATFTIECVSFDPECDFDVDLNDYALLRDCLGGPGQGVSATCARFDNDGDGDVDLVDMSEFFAQFTGPF